MQREITCPHCGTEIQVTVPENAVEVAAIAWLGHTPQYCLTMQGIDHG